jgi:predicted xylose isomerase-like sugar epimerase
LQQEVHDMFHLHLASEDTLVQKQIHVVWLTAQTWASA